MKLFPQEVYLHGLGKFPDYVYSIDFSWGGERPFVATGGADSIARVWVMDAESNLTIHQELTGHTLGVNCVRFSPDGRNALATASDDGKVIIWRPRRTEEGVRWFPDRAINCLDEVTHVAWSPDGSQVVCAQQREVSVIYDVTTGRPLQRLDGHSNRVLGVAWDTANSLIVSMSTDRSARVYARSKKHRWYVKSHIRETEDKAKLFMSESH